MANSSMRGKKQALREASHTSMEPIEFVQRHGVVLEGARGPVPNLAEFIAGRPIEGSWWGHPKGREIFWATRQVRDSPSVLVCRLIDGKITYIHRRLWPALVRLASALEKERLAAIREEHTAAGTHRVRTTPYPRWVPTIIRASARHLSTQKAISEIGVWVRSQLR